MPTVAPAATATPAGCARRASPKRASPIPPAMRTESSVRIARPAQGRAIRDGLVAQSVEHRTFNPLVLGSIPSQPTIFRRTVGFATGLDPLVPGSPAARVRPRAHARGVRTFANLRLPSGTLPPQLPHRAVFPVAGASAPMQEARG